MLKLTDIVKDYRAGDETVHALRGISIEFRKSEFVAILGPSGCGKTTLLNIISGLDQYTSGDLSINGRSTKRFKSSDWDSYRNHSVGFVFQSYNLIPHQTVLSNVELALTLSGVGKTERRKRAVDALKRVGLGDQLKKKPNQMSGGQMQRVAIARALVNDPDILMADEPTGALDSATSVQIMEILKEISKDKLVVMVTHNPELAEKYATRIVRCLDGQVISDSSPYSSDEVSRSSEMRVIGKSGKTSMSFMTALSLSLNNLMTKKGRTILTSFAGSIGIIGIALILSVSTGVNKYIDRVQEDTLASYPITINAEEVDMTSMMTAFMGQNNESEPEHELNAVYENRIMSDMMDSMSNIKISSNNLSRFKEFLDSSSELSEYASAVSYSYGGQPEVYVKDADGNIVRSDVMELISRLYSELGVEASSSTLSSYMQLSSWQELLSGMNGEIINPTILEQYDVISGRWPQGYDEVVVAVDENNEISDMMLYTLGLKTLDEIIDDMTLASEGKKEELSSSQWSYEDILGIDFRVIPDCDKYQRGNSGYIDASQTQTGLKYLYDSDNSIKLKVVGIIRPSEDAVSSYLSGAVGYTSALSEHIIEHTQSSSLVTAQKQYPDTDVLSGLRFKSEESDISEEMMSSEVYEWIAGLSVEEKAELYRELVSIPTAEYLSASVDSYISSRSQEELEGMLLQAIAGSTQMDEETIMGYISGMEEAEKDELIHEIVEAAVLEQYSKTTAAGLSERTSAELSYMLDSTELSQENISYIYNEAMPARFSDRTYEEVLKLLGEVDITKPTAINIYAASFEDKDKIAELIEEYNLSVPEEDKISYRDYVKLLMSSVTTIISAISYVLMAFVAISLVVSSIMIGVITYISVLERTKEIGILRAVGASKRDISRVFNAETMIVGFAAGAFGIGLTLLLLIPINIILHVLTGIEILSASLPIAGAVILIAISMGLTMISGLIPSRLAAKKDPVEALRTE